MAVISLSLTDASERRLRELAAAPARAIEEIGQAVKEILVGVENELKVNLLRGGDPGQPRDGRLPLASRSGSLLGSINHEQDGPLSGVYGTTDGPASQYARGLLDDGETTITPTRAKHLWIPIADNLTRSGQTRMSPREAFEQKGPRGGRLLSIFRLDAITTWSRFCARPRAAAAPSRGAGTEGRQRGRLLFVLKDEVTVKGTNALRVAWDNREGFSVQRLEQGLARAIGGTA